MNPESVDVTAGLGGFLAFFLLALALYFLMRNMNARLRRMAYREQEQASRADDGPAPDGPDSDGPGADGPAPDGPAPDGPDSAGPKGGPKDAPDIG